MKKIFFTFLLGIQISIFSVETRFINERGFNQIWLWQLSNTTVTQEKGVTLSYKSDIKYKSSDSLWSGKLINNNFYLGTSETSSILKIDKNSYQETEIFNSSNHSIITTILPEKDGILFAASPNSTIYHLDKNNTTIASTEVSNTYIWDIVANSEGNYTILGSLPAEVHEYKNKKLQNTIAIETEDHLLKGLYIGNTLWILGEKGLYKKVKDTITIVATFVGSASSFVYTNNTFYVLHTVSTDANPAINQPEQITSRLSRVNAKNGLVEDLYTMQGFYFTSLAIIKNQIIIGADQFGFYSFYDLVTKKIRYSSLGEGKILDIFQHNNELFVITSDYSGIWAISEQLATEGSFISEVYDAGSTASWGQFQAQIATPPNTSVQFYIQSGVTPNTKYWEDWQIVNLNQKIPSTSARYIRYKAILKSDGKNIPYVQEVRFPYTQLNLSPTIQNTQIKQENQNINISWVANDPNSDELSFDVFLADDGLPKVKLNTTPLRDTNFTFDTRNFPSGTKKITVVATDLPSNTLQTALYTESTSLPIMFDGEVPVISDIEITKKRNTIVARFNVQDQHSVIKRVQYITNGAAPIVVLPEDGIYDQQLEQFSIEIPWSETMFLQIQAFDEASNSSVKGSTILAPR